MPEGVRWEHSNEDWLKGVNRALFVAMHGWMRLSVQRARQWAPVRSGRLVREIKADPETPRLEAFLRVLGIIGVSGLAYARAHELGSGIHGPDKMPYPIKPRYAKVLAFPWPNAPEAVRRSQPGHEKTGLFFFASVQHPGVRPPHGKGYLRPGVKLEQAAAERLLLEALKAEMVI